MNLIHLGLFGFFILSSSIASAQQVPEPSLAELVQSVPEETTIADATLPDARDVWLKMIQGAKSSIDLGQMYLNNISEKGLKNELEPVIQALEEAGNKRGIKIRVILSAQMKDTDKVALSRFQKIKNAEVRIYDLGKLTGGIIHAKYWVVDGKEVFVGSQNTDWKALTQIHELGIHLVDPMVAKKLTDVFEKDWATIGRGKLETQVNVPAECKTLSTYDVVASPPVLNPAGVCDSISVLLSMIKQAQKKIAIQVMDYSLSSGSAKWTEIDDALRTAAKRGVKVRLMVSNWSTDKPSIDHLKDLSLVPGIEIKIVTVPDLKAGRLAYARLIHSKYMVVDDGMFWLGTSNWSKGYFYNTRGVEIVVQKPEFAAKGYQIFELIWTQPYSEFIDVNRNYPKPKKD